MRLDITEGRGGVTVYRVSAGDDDPGAPKAVSVVVDPANTPHGPEDLAEWIQATGGSVPLPEPGETGGSDDAPEGGRAGTG